MKVTVVGLGYVGSVASGAIAAAGHEVVGIDVDLEKVRAFQNGSVLSYEPGLSDLINKGLAARNLRFEHRDEFRGALGEVVVICTGTPTTPTGAADMGQVETALSWVRERHEGVSVVIMKSTVPPGVGLRLFETGLSGTGIQYVSNPEFLREGQAVYDWFNPDRIVIGTMDESCMELVKSIYTKIDAPYVVTDITSAEMIKYASNAFLATKISFINEIATLCDRLGATIDDVTQGIALDPRIGRSYMRAGVGYGGSCFPKDVRALDQVALSNNHNFELLRSVIAVNNRQRLVPLYALRDRFHELKGSRIAVLGLAFKPDTDDIREAPSLDLINALVECGAWVTAYDPEARANAQRALPPSVRITETLEECVEGAEAIVLMTEWSEFVNADWGRLCDLAKEPKLLFDGRNALDPTSITNHGFEYMGIGRGTRKATPSQLQTNSIS